MVRWLWDWFCVWVVMSVLCGVSRGDVLLWNSPFTGGVEFSQIAGGQIRSTAIDLGQAATMQQLSLALGQPIWLAGTGGPSQISLWLDSTPGERRTQIYSGGFRNSWSGLSVDLPKGRSWLSVENLTGSATITWGQALPASGSGALVTSAGTTATGQYMGSARGVPVPEPEFAGLLLVCCAAGIFWAWKGRAK